MWQLVHYFGRQTKREGIGVSLVSDQVEWLLIDPAVEQGQPSDGWSKLGG